MLTAIAILGLLSQGASRPSAGWLKDALAHVPSNARTQYAWASESSKTNRPKTKKVVNADGSLLYTVWDGAGYRRMTQEEIDAYEAKLEADSKKIEEGRQLLIAHDLLHARQTLTEAFVEQAPSNYPIGMYLAIVAVLEDKPQEALALMASYRPEQIRETGALVVAYSSSQGTSDPRVAAFCTQSLRSVTRGMGDDMPVLANSQKTIATLALGIVLYTQLGPDVAIDLFTQCLADEPTNPLASYYVGQTALDKGQYAKAVASFDVANSHGGPLLKKMASSKLGYAKWRLDHGGGNG